MKKYKFELDDISALLTVANVVLLLLGWEGAPAFGITNCALSIGRAIRHKSHFNIYVINVAILVLNFYFLL